MNRRKALGTIALASLGGCLRLTDQQTGEQRTPPQPGQDRTPSGDGPTESSGDASYPTGLSDDGVEGFLLDTHKRELAQTSFETEWTLIDLIQEEVLERKEYAVDSGEALGSWTFDRGGPVQMFRSSDGGYWREDLSSKYTYGRSRSGYSIEHMVWADWIRPVLASGQWGTPARRSDGSLVMWDVDASGVEDGATVPGYFSGSFDALSASLTVDERGIISQLTATYEASGTNEGPIEHQIEYSVDSIGSASVSEPAWLDTAVERTPDLSATLTEDRKFVELTHEGGNPLEPATAFVLYDDTERYNAIWHDIQDPIEAGETVYFYKEQEGQSEGRLSRGSRPSSASPVTLDSVYSAWAIRGTVEYCGVLQV